MITHQSLDFVISSKVSVQHLGPTLPPQLVLDGLHASLLLDEVVDDFGRLSVLQLRLRDAAHVEQVLQLRIQVVQLSTAKLTLLF